MATDQGDGWGDREAAPPGTPRFEWSSTAQPLGSTELPPMAPPPPPPGWGFDPSWAQVTGPPVPRRVSMTRGWAWTALVLILLIPASVVVATTFLISNEANYDPDADTQEEGWIWLIVFIWVFLWSALCAVSALVCAIAGTVRSRRHPERPQAPVVAVVVWVFLAILATPVLLTIVGGFL